MSVDELRKEPFLDENTTHQTPFDRAKSEWDDRIGKLVMTGRGLWVTVYVLLGIVSLLIVFLFSAMSRSTIEPYMVVVDSKGIPIKVVPVKEIAQTPTELMTATHVAQVIEWTRSVYKDKVLMREKILSAYKYMTPIAGQKLTAHMQQKDPFTRTDTVQIRLRSIVKVPNTNSYQASWGEITTTENGQESPEESWTGIFTVTFEDPQAAEDLLINPLTMKIVDYNWQRDF